MSSIFGGVREREREGKKTTHIETIILMWSLFVTKFSQFINVHALFLPLILHLVHLAVFFQFLKLMKHTFEEPASKFDVTR